MTILTGRANPGLANLVAQRLGVPLGNLQIDDFPDGELHIELKETVQGHDVYIIQPTSPPVAKSLLELLLVSDACHRGGALQVTAVTPYFGYARQDRRVRREPISARLVADLFSTAHLRRVLIVDLHNPLVEGFFTSTLEHLSAIPVLADTVRASGSSVVVSPDLGGVNLAGRYATALGLPLAIIHKERISGEEVIVHAITGNVKGKFPLIVDDMISTGGTIEAAANALLAAGCEPSISIAATHGLLAGPAVSKLERIPIRQFCLTNSVVTPSAGTLPIEVVDLSFLLAEAIRRIYRGGTII
ncbi:MAG: ribose-phosphate pyrophosphokinase [Dehalococcoidales bacterium]|nr:ribose-phosphate pyrophosphokinase [Dehalococcoidales bacterium]